MACIHKDVVCVYEWPTMSNDAKSRPRQVRCAPALALLGLAAVGCAAGRGASEASNGRSSSHPPGYHRVRTIHLGGEGRWDTLTFDLSSRRLFIARETHVVVLDVDRERVVGEIPDTAGVHAVAVAPDLGRGFTSNGRAGTVTIFDLKTLAVLKQVPVGQNPDAIVYDHASQRVFAMNGRSDDVSIIDVKTGTVIATLPLGGRPEFGVADGLGALYVNLEDKGEAIRMSTQTTSITARWPLAPCIGPSGIAIDTAARRVFAACANRTMIVLDADSGQAVATLPIGTGVDGAAFDAGNGLAFSSNGEGTLTVVGKTSTGSYAVLEDVATQRGARTMALDPARHQVLLATADFEPAPPSTGSTPPARPKPVPGTFAILVFGR